MRTLLESEQVAMLFVMGQSKWVIFSIPETSILIQKRHPYTENLGTVDFDPTGV